MESTGIGAPIGTQRNARVAHIRKFVCVPPERGHTLRLVAVEDPPVVLGEWPKVACVDNGSTADDVDALLRDHATTTGTEVIANLAWQSVEGLVVMTKRLKCKPEPSADTDPAAMAQAEAAGLDGSRRADQVQLQREREAFIRSYFSAHQTQNAQYIQLAKEQRELITTLAGCLREQYSHTHQANLAIDKQRAELRRALDEAASEIREAEASADDGGEGGARKELIEMVGKALGQALPFIVQAVGKMMAEAPAANANATAPHASAAE